MNSFNTYTDLCCKISRKNFPPLLFVIVYSASLMLFTSGCDQKVLYDDNKTIIEGVWKDDRFIRFVVPVDDTMNTHAFYLNVRHSTEYKYANLFVFINTIYPDGDLARDTVELILADRSGKWLGKGITNMRDNQVLLRRGLRFPKKGAYVFEIEQAMREPELNGIKDIGIRIVKD